MFVFSEELSRIYQSLVSISFEISILSVEVDNVLVLLRTSLRRQEVDRCFLVLS